MSFQNNIGTFQSFAIFFILDALEELKMIAIVYTPFSITPWSKTYLFYHVLHLLVIYPYHKGSCYGAHGSRGPNQTGPILLPPLHHHCQQTRGILPVMCGPYKGCRGHPLLGGGGQLHGSIYTYGCHPAFPIK